MKKNFQVDTKITKVDSGHGLVFGWGIITKVDGQDYVDLGTHHISDEVMLNSVVDFMLNSRVIKDMHTSEPLDGSILFSFPLTEEIAKKYKIESSINGFMIAMKLNDGEMLNKFRTGERTGFSLGGLASFEED